MPSSLTGSRITFLLVFAALLPGFAAFAILYQQALPVPYQDDYNTILVFATGYDQLPAYQTKLLDIATFQSNEYKLGFEHAIVAAELEFTRHLNFAFLTALGDLFLLPLGYLLWLTYREGEHDLNQRLLAFLPISFLFFSLTYWENLNWTTTGLQNIPVIFFALLAIYLLQTWPLPACLAAALAAFTSANGFLLGPIGLWILLRRRAYAWSLLWCASFVPPLAAYLYHYSPLPHPVDIGSYVTRPLFFLAFLGCGAIPFRWPAALAGIVILRILWMAFRARFDRTHPVAFYFTVWILATAALVAWVRGAASFAIGSRYSIYSILVLIFCYSFLAQYLSTNRRRFYVTSLVLAVGICFLADVHAWQKLRARRQMVLSGIALYRANPILNSPMIDVNLLRGFPQEREFEQDALTKAIREHVYTLPPR